MRKTNNTVFRVLIYFIFFTLLFGVIISCNQDSIFADISVEPPPVDPLIKGSPTNIVLFDDVICVAGIGADTIHSYGSGKWTTLKPGKQIAALAATSTHLYALVYSDMMDTELRCYDGAAKTWTTINKGTAVSMQTLFSANDHLFVGAKNGNTWSIYYDNSGTLVPVIINIAELNGAAFSASNYFLATGNGVYMGNNLSAFPADIIQGSAGNIKGIINVNGVITAVSRDGRILRYDTGEFKIVSSTSDYHYTGAMWIWEETGGSNQLLLLGVQGDGSYNKGYRELTLVGGVPPASGAPVTPGGSLSSVKPDDKSRYDASLAKYSVYSILQVPLTVDTPAAGKEPLIFASTALNGLFVLKDGQWNAQD